MCVCVCVCVCVCDAEAAKCSDIHLFTVSDVKRKMCARAHAFFFLYIFFNIYFTYCVFCCIFFFFFFYDHNKQSDLLRLGFCFFFVFFVGFLTSFNIKAAGIDGEFHFSV